jgi:type VI secretion system secreted protein Hcp
MSQFDCFLKIDGVQGESKDARHKGEIDVESYSWGMEQSGSMAYGGGGGAGKVAVRDFNFVMKMNKASPRLFLAAGTGQHFKEATLTCRKAGGEQVEFMIIRMTDLLVSSFQTGGAGNTDVVPTEQISMNFAKVEFEYKEQKADGTLGGSVKAGWDVKATKKL